MHVWVSQKCFRHITFPIKFVGIEPFTRWHFDSTSFLFALSRTDLEAKKRVLKCPKQICECIDAHRRVHDPQTFSDFVRNAINTNDAHFPTHLHGLCIVFQSISVLWTYNSVMNCMNILLMGGFCYRGQNNLKSYRFWNILK